MDNYRIPVEVLQCLSSEEAWEYRLVPFEREGGKLRCYGEEGKDYSGIKEELRIIYGREIEIEGREKREFFRLLEENYRSRGPAVTAPVSAKGKEKSFLEGWIDEACRNSASDIHFEPYEERCRVRFRIDGMLTERYVVEKAEYAALVNQVKIMANLDISEKRLPQDGRIFYRNGQTRFDIRVSCLPVIHGEKVVLRLLTRQSGLSGLEQLGMEKRQLEGYVRAIGRPNGLVLISGPTGSGKSTTLYATLRKLNRESNNILTIEDPVEYTLEGVNQVQLKEEIGLTFAEALRTFLRQDPDIIMLGEIRDAETARMAVRSSLTGHLLLSTIHTNSAWGCISRLKDMGIEPYLLSETLAVCVAQRLVRLLCKKCRRRLLPDESFPQDWFSGYQQQEYYEPVGCPDCYFTGYSGRKAIYEVIPVDEELAAMIRGTALETEVFLKRKQIPTLRDAALRLVAEGETSLPEVLPLLTEKRIKQE